MKVFHIISSAGYYGAESVVIQLTRALAILGCDPTLGVFHNRSAPNPVGGLEIAARARRHSIPVEIIDCGGRIDLATASALGRLIRRNQFDLVHAHGYKADIYAFLASLTPGSHRRVPLVSTCHNWTGQGPMIRLYGHLDRLALRRFDHIVAVSEPVAAILRNSGILPARITIIDNGIPCAEFAGAQPLYPAPPGVSLTIGMVARVVAEKGCDTFLEAARLLLSRFPGIRFLLIGDGPQREPLLALSRDLDGRFLLPGNSTDMPGAYASLDILVLPSFNEGLPMTILEAMAAEVPVIATPVGAIPRLIRDRETGLLVRPGDAGSLAAAITSLIEDEDLRRRCARNATQLVSDLFSADAMARRYQEIYRSVVKVLYC